MISEFYLKKALNIRKEYLSIVSNINLFENMAKDILKIIEGKLEELNTLQSKINEKKVSNIESAKDSLLKIILDLEEESNNIFTKQIMKQVLVLLLILPAITQQQKWLL